ncbi:hypothetical protein D9757_003479 [Collybiopsis confluens]|uniref:RNA-dependent RNA polymerase n=1 Tax=Collybiopsis confluens TaxID=2823264 RepID=A0A8H5MD28_9AGAR|nr:hypothetical protein D9757_003479 [Collybiopsis confluens]
MEIFVNNIDTSLSKYDVKQLHAVLLKEFRSGPGYRDFQKERINFEVHLDGGKDGRPHMGKGALTLPSTEIARHFLSEYGWKSECRDFGGPPPKKCIMSVSMKASYHPPKLAVVEQITRLPYRDPAVAEREDNERATLNNSTVNISQIQFGCIARDQALSEHTVWFLREFYDDQRNCMVDSDTIIRRIGTFDNLELRRCPALYGARISQAFTATEASLVEVEGTLTLGDVITDDGEYNFTDGVGTMSHAFAERVFYELRYSSAQADGSCCFRFPNPIRRFQRDAQYRLHPAGGRYLC